MENNEMGRAYGTCVYRVLVRNSEGKNHLEDPGEDGSIILRWIFRKLDGVNGHDRFGS
jgi:hypothetical protein